MESLLIFAMRKPTWPTRDKVQALLGIHDLLQGQQVGVAAHRVHNCHLSSQQRHVVPKH